MWHGGGGWLVTRQQQHAIPFCLHSVGSLLFEEDSEVVNSPKGVPRDAEHMLALLHYTAAQLILIHLDWV